MLTVAEVPALDHRACDIDRTQRCGFLQQYALPVFSTMSLEKNPLVVAAAVSPYANRRSARNPHLLRIPTVPMQATTQSNRSHPDGRDAVPGLLRRSSRARQDG